ncbi:MAG: DcaP family trimeric outer membrane transporter [Gemmatimonadales bacterium]
MKSHLLAAALVGLPVTLAAQGEARSKFEVYGYAMLDAGYNFDQSDPAWFDVVRPSKLPAFENQFAPDGTTFFSVRQSRLGVRSAVPTDLGDLKTVFEFELFGTGVDAGQTTFRLRHIYGELGRFGAGQTWSPFSDSDVLPNVLDHWGPSGIVSFRNAQVRWMPIQGDTRLTIALERPGASADEGVVADRIELDDVRGRFPVPDLSAEYRHAATWGYVEVAGIVRYIKWEDQGADAFDLSGDATGWGVNLSSNLKLGGQNLARLQVVYGEGIENNMGDAPADIGIEANPGNPTAPIRGVALPVLGVVAFVEHKWNEKFASSVGYSLVEIDNSELQAPDAFGRGQYALGNVRYSPVPGVMTGVELQWGDRENFSDGFSSSVVRIQFSAKYNFSRTW